MKFSMKNLVGLFIISFLVFSLVECKKEEKVTDNTPKINQEQLKKDQERADSIKKAQERIKFTSLVFPKDKKDSMMSVFLKEYSEEERYTILALNRLDNKNRWRADTLVIPEKFADDFLAYAPFPHQLDVLKDVDKIAFFAYPNHAYALYENGKLIKWGPSSMGKKSSQTKRGLMFTNWKKEVAVSTVDSDWILRWNFNTHNTLGIGWHQYDLPGFHASHSCLRLLEADAKWMYSWADQWVLTNQGNTVEAKGTPVIVFGESDFKSKPWLSLLQDPTANDISEKEMNDLIQPNLDEILKEQAHSKKIRGDEMLSKDKTAKNSETKKETA